MPVPGDLAGGIQRQRLPETLDYLNTVAVHVRRFAGMAPGAVTAEMMVDAGVQVYRHPAGGHSYLYWPGRLDTPMKCFNGAQAARLFMNVQGWQQAVLGAGQAAATASDTAQPQPAPALGGGSIATKAEETKPPVRTEHLVGTLHKPEPAAADVAAAEHIPKRRKVEAANGVRAGPVAAAAAAAAAAPSAPAGVAGHDGNGAGSGSSSPDPLWRSVRDTTTELSQAHELATSVSSMASGVLQSLPGAVVLTAGLDQQTLDTFAAQAQALQQDLAADQAIYEQMLERHNRQAAAAAAAAGSSNGIEAAAAKRKPFLTFRGALEECVQHAHSWLHQGHQKKLLEKLRAVCQVKGLVDKYEEASQQLQQLQSGQGGPKGSGSSAKAAAAGPTGKAPPAAAAAAAAEPSKHAPEWQQQVVKAPQASTEEQQRLAALLQQQKQQQQRLQKKQEQREKQMTDSRQRESDDLRQHQQQEVTGQPTQAASSAAVDSGVISPTAAEDQFGGKLVPEGSGGSAGAGSSGGTVLTFLQQFMKNAPAGQAGTHEAASRGPATEGEAAAGGPGH